MQLEDLSLCVVGWFVVDTIARLSVRASERPQRDVLKEFDEESRSIMEEAARKPQRPLIVIGTYDSCHQHGHRTTGSEASSDLHQQLVESSRSDGAGVASTAEQSTDLFSYCRASQLSYLNHHMRKIFSPPNGSGQYNHNHHLARYNKLKLNLNQIKGPTGSVRGHKDVVRKSLENIRAVVSISSKRNFGATNFQSFQSMSSRAAAADAAYSSLAYPSSLMGLQQMDEHHKAEFLERLAEEELGQCVAYSTTLGVIRRTFEDCKLMRSILNSNLIKYEERDIYLNQEYKKQLRLRCNAIQLPVLFVDGKHFGSIKELEQMNEDGSLAIQLARFKMSEAPRHVCYCCGNAKFIACQSCNGSRKSAVHHFKYNSIALRCIKCDKNDGLIDCPVCQSSQPCSPPATTGATKSLPTDDNNNNNNCNISSA